MTLGGFARRGRIPVGDLGQWRWRQRLVDGDRYLDPNGNKILKIDAAGNVTTSSYDANNLKLQDQFSNGTQHDYTWDAVGNRSTAVDPTGTYTTTYSARNEVLTVTNPDGKEIQYRYDGRRSRVGMTDPDGGVFTNVYDPATRLIVVTNPQSEATTLSYDAANREIQKELANGAITTQAYDNADRLTGLVNAIANGNLVGRYTHSYDNAGHKLTCLEANGDLTSWTYDKAYQLSQEQRTGKYVFNTNFTYDPAGNRTLRVEIDGQRVTSTYDAANQIAVVNDSLLGVTTFTHDNNGNRIEQNAAGIPTYYGWDPLNRMTAVEPPAGAVTMTYNADSKRVEKTTPTHGTKFIYDFEKVLQEADANSLDTLKGYTWTDQQYGNLVSDYFAGPDQTRYHEFDAQGNTAALLDDNQGTRAAMRYRAFGLAHPWLEGVTGSPAELASSMGLNLGTAALTSPYEYGGKLAYWHDRDLEVYFLALNPPYDPMTGTRLGKDSLYPQSGANAYQWCGNDPVNKTDPSGQEEIWFKNWSEIKKTGESLFYAVAHPLDSTEAATQNLVREIGQLRKDVEFVEQLMAKGQNDSIDARMVAHLQYAREYSKASRELEAEGNDDLREVHRRAAMAINRPIRRADLEGRAKAFVTENMADKDRLGRTALFGVVKGGLAAAEAYVDVTGTAYAGKAGEAARKGGAFGLGALEKSSVLSIPASVEHLKFDLQAALDERRWKRQISDKEIETREGNAMLSLDLDKTLFILLQKQTGAAADQLDFKSAERGRAAAPIVELILATVFIEALPALLELGGLGDLASSLRSAMAGRFREAFGWEPKQLPTILDLPGGAGAGTDFAPRPFNRGAHPVQLRGVPYQARTVDLPNVIHLEELHRIRGIPGSEGVELAPGSIDRQVFRRMWELSDYHGIEYGLVKVRRLDGSEVWRMYSGSSGSVTYNIQRGEQIVRFGGHVHPSGNPDPSYFFNESLGRMAGDVETLNRLWERMGYPGRLPHSRVVYGPNRVDTTRYFPNQGR